MASGGPRFWLQSATATAPPIKHRRTRRDATRLDRTGFEKHRNGLAGTASASSVWPPVRRSARSSGTTDRADSKCVLRRRRAVQLALPRQTHAVRQHVSRGRRTTVSLYDSTPFFPSTNGSPLLSHQSPRHLLQHRLSRTVATPRSPRVLSSATLGPDPVPLPDPSLPSCVPREDGTT